MIPISFRFRFRSGLAAAGLLAALGTAPAAVNYVFDETTPFDDSGIGASASLVDADVGNINVTMTTVDIIGTDGTLASTGTNNRVNVFGSTIDALGVNSANADNNTYSSESRDFNPNEGWIFVFSVDVNLVEIDLSSQGAGAQMTMSSPAFASFVLDDGQSNDIHDLGNTFVPAGSEITIQMTSDDLAGDTSLRISDLTVEAVPVPEPSGILLSLLASSLLVVGRRR